ncbi:hypothetical protein AVEN_35843-1 [Araneus ventricosus]|uniref:PiggyBac transposable element-derived protein domain-containing protein n=1 Tax=Araneus ventricosus TaxID=182803 RepID=A0A4Y2BLM2_ARAVE|nr:hypothetical protein AVEN_35843-1 [Araneus ventricosus]
MPTPYEKEMEDSLKLLAEVETDEDNGPEDVSEEIFSDHESFFEHGTESEEVGGSGNEDVNNLEVFLFLSKEGIEWRKRKFRHNIRCHNIASRFCGTKGPAKGVTSPVKSWELFINDNMIQLMVE